MNFKVLVFIMLLLPFFITFCQVEGDSEKLGDLADDDSIIAHYPLDGDARDISGNGHDGVLYDNPAPSNDRLNKPNRALYFSGTPYIEVPAERGINLSDTDFTVSVWGYANSFTSNRTLFCCLYSSSSEFLRLSINGSNQLVWVFSGQSGSSYTLTSSDWIWYHIACTWKDGHLKLYVNSVLVADESLSTAYTYSGNQRFFMGAQFYSSYTTNYFYGNIDNITIFKRALSEREVRRLYENSI